MGGVGTEHMGLARLCVRSPPDLSPGHCKPVGRLHLLFSVVALCKVKVKFFAPTLFIKVIDNMGTYGL